MLNEDCALIIINGAKAASTQFSSKARTPHRLLRVDSAISSLCTIIGSLLLLKPPIKLTFAAGTQLVEPATTGHTENVAHDSIDSSSIDSRRLTAADRHFIARPTGCSG